MTVLGVLLALYFAPQQQVRQQQGLDEAQKAADDDSPDFLIQDQRDVTDDPSEASADVFGLSDVQRGTIIGVPGKDTRLIPSDQGKVRIGSYPPGPGEVQPQAWSTIDFTLVGNHNTPVRISSITARVLSSEPPPAGTLVYIQEEGDTVDTSMGFDLDSGDLNGRVLDENSITAVGRTHYLDAHQITLAKNESVSFRMQVLTKKCLCTFVFDLKAADGRVQSVDDNGRPWVVSGFAPTYERSYTVAFADTGVQILPCTWPDDCREKYGHG